MVLLIGRFLMRETTGMGHHVEEALQEVIDHPSGVCQDPEVGIMSQGMRVLQEEVQEEEDKTVGVTEETTEVEEANPATKSEPFSPKEATQALLYP